MLRVFNIILKDLKLLIRSKSSALIAILGPLLIIFLVGLGFNTSTLSDLRLAVYSDSYSELSNSLVDKLGGNFVVIKENSKDTCIDGIKTREYHVCAVFPSNLDINSKDSIIFYVDYSRVNLVYNIIDTLTTELREKTSEISLELTKVLIDKLNNAKVELSGRKTTADSLSSNNAEAVSKAGSVESGLKGIDLDFSSSDVNTSDLEKKVSSTEAQYNATFTDIRSSISSLKTSIQNLLDKFTAAKSAKDSLINDIENLNNAVNKNSDDINEISSSINKLLNDISDVKVLEAENIISPIKTRIEPISSSKLNLSYLLPTMLILVVMLISMLVSSTMMVQEKNSKAYFRNFITPTSEIIFLVAHFLTNLIIVFIELFIILFIVTIFLGFDFFVSLFGVFIVLILVSSVFILIGMIIGHMFRSGETSNLTTIFVSSMMLFLSNTVLPIESLPSYLKSIVQYNPFVVGEFLLRKIILFKSGLISQWPTLLLLIVMILVLGVFTYLARELTKRRLA